MEAKDTVINPDELGKAIMKHPGLPMGQAISIEQAEVTFKAMQESRHSIPTIVDIGNDAFKDGKKAGIKEVVKWMQWYGGLPEWIDMHMPEQWQAKLKEWEIGEKE